MDPFATLGLERSYRIDPRELERRYRELQKALHPDRHSSAPASHRRMNLSKAMEVNEAYRTLRDDLKRAQALLELHGVTGAADNSSADPEFLMEVMELRESLSEAKAAGDAAGVEALSERVESAREQAARALGERFGRCPSPGPEDLRVLSDLLGRLRYYQRFMDEVEIIQEEL